MTLLNNAFITIYIAFHRFFFQRLPFIVFFLPLATQAVLYNDPCFKYSLSGMIEYPTSLARLASLIISRLCNKSFLERNGS